MLTTRQMWLLLLIIGIAALVVFGAFIRPWIKERRRTRAAVKREAVRRSLIDLTMGDLTTHQELQARRMARDAGLDFDNLMGDEDKFMQRIREREERDRIAMLEKVRAERVRQEALEAEAIKSILDEVPEPRHDGKFQ